MPAILSGYLAVGSAFSNGVLTELSGSGYARPAVTVNYDPAVGLIGVTGGEFGPASGTWTAGATLAVYDAITGGNLLFAVPCTTAAIVSGASFAIPAFAVQLTTPLAASTPALANIGIVTGALAGYSPLNGAVVSTGAASLAYSVAASTISATSAPFVLTPGTTINTDASKSTLFTLALGAGATSTLANPTNLVVGARYRWRLTQNASASTLAFGTLFLFVGGSKTISIGSGAIDVIVADYDGTSLLCMLNKAYA